MPVGHRAKRLLMNALAGSRKNYAALDSQSAGSALLPSLILIANGGAEMSLGAADISVCATWLRADCD